MAATDRALKRWLIATGSVYALGAIDFVARPWAATASLNRFGGERIDHEPGGLYNSLAAAYMGTIAALSFSAARDPQEHIDLIAPLLAAKAASSAALLYRFFVTGKRGFAVAAGIDALLLGATAGLSTRLAD